MDELRLYGLAACVPDTVVTNQDLSALTGRAPEWFERVTGIRERRRLPQGTSAEDLAQQVVRKISRDQRLSVDKVDLIVGCTYTPHDTIGTLAHVVQRELGVPEAIVFTLSSACSSMINGLEVAAAMIESGRATSALLVGTEHNSRFARDSDDRAGHLWGDAAAAVLVTAEDLARDHFQLLDVITTGRATLGTGPRAISLRIGSADISMPDGRSVFSIACRELVRVSELLLRRNGLTASDIRWLVPHQANRRIMDQVLELLGLPPDRLVSTIETHGNTGCVSALLSLAAISPHVTHGDLIMVPVFGGGFSSGAALLRYTHVARPAA